MYLRRWEIVVLILAVLFYGALAFADDAQPCRAVGDTVVCTRTGFDTLVGKLLDAQAASKKCVLEAESRTADMKVLDAKLALAISERDLARAEVEVWKTRPFPRGRMLTAAGLGVLGGVAGSLVPRVESDAAALGLGSLSLVSIAAAVVLVALE